MSEPLRESTLEPLPEPAVPASVPSTEEQVLLAIPDLGELRRQIDFDPADVIPPPAQVLALVGDQVLLGKERDELLAFARKAVEAFQQGQPLNVEAQKGVAVLQTFVTRPALLVQDGLIVSPPPVWAGDLNVGRLKVIERDTLPAVGRIEVDGHPKLPWLGTGWVAAPGLVITNWHVVRGFAAPVSGRNGEWRIKQGMAARIDFGEEQTAVSGDESHTFDIPQDAHIRVHPTLDLAVVPVQATGRGAEARSLPSPLRIASHGDFLAGRKVYACGYPGEDPVNQDLLIMYELFNKIFGVKRFQPGQVMSVLPETNTVLHDCSTLGGNSGSCLVDLPTNRVIGLHYAGAHRRANFAIALWRLIDDPFLKEMGIPFET